ncbi:hypothetical protein F2Q68_00022538 [Brassica cretica]|uniref:Aminotransferase-like plant mobile domain-containing protein n=1 Tax=Brassica cretica TaxID=69181 RepID=A0A8S9FXC0_BRACR|nr:hypothetical protein F2Q68_00022538 [Brassica cretica]
MWILSAAWSHALTAIASVMRGDPTKFWTWDPLRWMRLLESEKIQAKPALFEFYRKMHWCCRQSMNLKVSDGLESYVLFLDVWILSLTLVPYTIHELR